MTFYGSWESFSPVSSPPSPCCALPLNSRLSPHLALSLLLPLDLSLPRALSIYSPLRILNNLLAQFIEPLPSRPPAFAPHQFCAPREGAPAIEESAVAVWEADYVAAKYGMAAAQARIKKLEGEVIICRPRGATGIEQESHKLEGEASDI
ncbi:hypothetical protein EV122DRAFT_292461 [Schizophyllum commune]